MFNSLSISMYQAISCQCNFIKTVIIMDICNCNRYGQVYVIAICEDMEDYGHGSGNNRLKYFTFYFISEV